MKPKAPYTIDLYAGSAHPNAHVGTHLLCVSHTLYTSTIIELKTCISRMKTLEVGYIEIRFSDRNVSLAMQRCRTVTDVEAVIQHVARLGQIF